MAKKASPSGLMLVSPGWSMVTSSIVPPGGKAGRRAAAGASVSFLPDYLLGTDFEVLDSAELRSAPARRQAGGEAVNEIRLSTLQKPDTAVFLVVRQESGAISFHQPEAGLSGLADQVSFQVSVGPQSGGSARRGLLSRAVKVALVRIGKAALDAVAKFTVPLLASKLEERLWKGRQRGWLRVTDAELASKDGQLIPQTPSFAASQRGLLFLHGTFSHTHSAFGRLAGTGFFDQLQPLYGSNIYAYNHFTFSATPAENVIGLLDALPDRDFQWDVITHSRGGLVARELIDGVGLRHPRRRRLKFGQVVMVASPNAGTPLGSPDHWDHKLSYVANLIEMLPENPFTIAADWLNEALKWFAANVLGNCPGLMAMDPQDSSLRQLQGRPVGQEGARYHAMVSNFQPSGNLAARVADMGVDQFFEAANDLVVPSEGGWKTSNQVPEWVPGNRVACFGPGGNLPAGPAAVHHSGYFQRPEAREFILNCLRGTPSNLTPIAIDRPLPVIGRRAAKLQAGIPPRVATEGAVPITPIATGGGTGGVAGQKVPEIRMADGFDVEEELWLTVVSNKLHSDVGQETTSDVPMLLAQYGSARVAVPFYIRGKTENAGERWQQIIKKQIKLTKYANGQEFTSGSDAIPELPFLKEFGDELFRTLFPGEVRNLYNIARYQHKKRRLKIIFCSMIPWVADIPWELAYDQGAEQFLACSDVRFIRNVLTPQPANLIPARSGPLRILVVSAQPTDQGALSIADEEAGIRESFRPLIDAGLVEVEVLAGATPLLLQDRLIDLPEDVDFDVLHFIGHGTFDEDNGTGTLLFQTESGQSRSVTGPEFLEIVRGRNIRVIFLNACETGRGQKADYNRGVAMELVRDGIPAVVANQYSVIDRSASLFSQYFYAWLAKGLKISDAMREARIVLRRDGIEPIDWAVPVLFASNPDARLCQPTGRRPGAAADESDLPHILQNDGLRRGEVVGQRKVVAVWDAENSLAYRENLQGTLDELNSLQDAYHFQLERFTAPRGLWTVGPRKSSSSIAYLSAERIPARMDRIRKAIHVDFLVCVTNLPLRDDQFENLYYYCDQQVAVFSIHDFTDELTGRKLQKAVANILAISLLDSQSGIDYGGTSDNDPENPIHTVGFWNGERNVDHIAGPMKILPALDKKFKADTDDSCFTLQQYQAIKLLLRAYE